LAHLPDYADLAKDGKWTGVVRFRPQRAFDPIRKRKPQTYFVCSTSDIFHPSVERPWIDKVWATMSLSPHHTFDVLTKRAERAAEYLSDPELGSRLRLWMQDIQMQFPKHPCRTIELPDLSLKPLANVRLGASASTAKDLKEQVRWLKQAPARVRWLSLEPLLEPISLAAEGVLPHMAQWVDTDPSPSGRQQGRCTVCGRVSPGFEKVCSTYGMIDSLIDWIVIGGESGPKARPFNIEWAMTIIKQARFANVPVYMKQVGANAWLGNKFFRTVHPKGEDPTEWPKELFVQQEPRNR